MADHSPEMLASELEVFLARAGMALPDVRAAAVHAGYADFRALLDLLHAPLQASEEPANVFRAKGAAR